LKSSEVTLQDVKAYARIDFDYEDSILEIILEAMKEYIKNCTELSYEQIDEKKDLTLVLLALCNEVYDNRQVTTQKSNINVVIKSILSKYNINLI